MSERYELERFLRVSGYRFWFKGILFFSFSFLLWVGTEIFVVRFNCLREDRNLNFEYSCLILNILFYLKRNFFVFVF